MSVCLYVPLFIMHDHSFEWIWTEFGMCGIVVPSGWSSEVSERCCGETRAHGKFGISGRQVYQIERRRRENGALVTYNPVNSSKPE